jgi:cytochrome c-type biogenesis protein
MFGLLSLAFLAGILSFLAPCTLPVLPAYLAFAATPTRTGTIARTLSFGLGLVIVFTLLGVLAGSFGALISANKDLIARTAGLLFLILGIMVLSGKELPGFQLKADPSRTIIGSFLFGALFAIAWSGCIGPIVGFALVLAAQTQTAAQGGILLATYAIGLIVPLLIVSAFLDKLKGGRFLRLLRGKHVTIAGREYHTTQLITGVMLLVIGTVFLLRIDESLARSPLIGWLFDVEERLASALGITLS